MFQIRNKNGRSKQSCINNGIGTRHRESIGGRISRTRMDVRNKVALITGSAQGIGKALAEEFLKQGGQVCLVDINDAKGNETRTEFAAKYGDGVVYFLKCDVTKKEEVEGLFPKTMDRFGKIDVVVSNAGVIMDDYSNFEICVNINLVAMIRLTMLSVEHMKKHGGGVILNVASAAGYTPFLEFPVYSSTKAGVISFTRSLALRSELKNHNIRLNVFCPWFTATQLLSDNSNGLPPDANIFKAIEIAGVMSLDSVADAMMGLIRDEDAHGTILEVSEKLGNLRRDDIFKDIVPK